MPKKKMDLDKTTPKKKIDLDKAADLAEQILSELEGRKTFSGYPKAKKVPTTKKEKKPYYHGITNKNEAKLLKTIEGGE